MNFSTLKGLAIPEGNVTQITDESGNVIWKQAPAGANVKVTISNSGNYASMTQSPLVYLLIDGVRHNTAEEIIVPIGTVITCGISRQTSGSTTDGIYLNGTKVAYTSSSRYGASYDYTLTGDIDIVLSSGMTMSSGGGGMSQSFTAYIYITEL